MIDQTTLRTAILDASQPVPQGLTDGHGAPAGRRFSVYRNNVAVSLTEALETGFPVIAKLLGKENFRTVAGVFLRQHPPSSPLMMHYGAAFPGFLANFDPLAHLGYLADTARLELALRRSYHAADAKTVDPASLTAHPEDLPHLCLTLAPCVQLIRSRWPIHGIWVFNTRDTAPQPPNEGQNVLITRPEFDPIPRLLGPGAASFLTALNVGTPLGDAADTATTLAPDFDLTATLTLLLQDQAITHALHEKHT
ncbi:MAG: DUF2063 domain-containing protein [Rhodobacterales bacterium]|nr:MAG: DUF2063 domain-containing protein [Rhodobacterales bacterium]